MRPSALLPFVLLTALAQELPKGLVQAISQARKEVLLAAPRLTDQDIAKALHEAVTRRGVAVYLLVPPGEAEAKDAYTGSLALAGAQVRLARVSQYAALIDGQPVAVPGNPQVWRRVFVDTFAKAPPYRYEPRPTSVRVVPYNPFEQAARFVTGVMAREARLRQELKQRGAPQ